jgi:hypothetical protein
MKNVLGFIIVILMVTNTAAQYPQTIQAVNTANNGYTFLGRNNTPGNQDSYLYQMISTNYHIIGSNTNGVYSTLRKIGFAVGGYDTENDIKMTLDTQGRLGIGLTAPDAKLHVKGVAYFGNQNEDSWHRVAVGGSGGNYGSVGYGYKYTLNSHEHVYSVSDYASQLRFDVGGFNFLTAPNGSTGAQVPFVSAMIIKQDGSVGVGTTSPQYKLHVTGTGFFQNRLTVQGDIPNDNNAAFWNNSTTGYGFYSQGGGGGRYAFHFLNQTGSTIMYGKGDGNIGIGTTNPDAKLAVKGTIHAEEVKVDLSVPGPDYVFEKDYNLMSLEEIKAYIEKHKHLPEVPSAKEMETNGVNLSEMNMILLKKVEELTLHVIELKNENVQIKEENERQNRIIKKLNIK